MSKLFKFHFQKIFSVAFQIILFGFSQWQTTIFTVWRFSTASFSSVYFFDFVLRKIFFRIIFVKFQRQFFSAFWRIKIQNFQPNFFGDCTQRKSIGEVRGIRRTVSSRIHKRSRCFFRLTKLNKKTIWKAAANENFKISAQTSTPHFANIMLCAAQFSIFQQFFQIFSRKFVKISGLKCQNFSIFIFKKIFSVAFQIILFGFSQ